MAQTNKSVGIDNSALSEVISSSQSVRNFDACLRAASGCLYVPYTVLQELLNTRMPHREKALDDLGLLTQLLGPRFKITCPLSAIFAEEIQHKICRPPSLSSQTIRHVRGILENQPRGKKARYFEIIDLGNEKDRFYALDKRMMEEATRRFVWRDIAELLSAYTRPGPSNMWLEAISRRHRDLSPSLVIKCPSRYPAIFVWAAMGDLYSIGLAIDPKHRSRSCKEELKNLSRDRGSYYDNRLFAECAYCDIFVVQDRAFAKQARLANRKGIHNIEVLSVREFSRAQRLEGGVFNSA